MPQKPALFQFASALKVVHPCRESLVHCCRDLLVHLRPRIDISLAAGGAEWAARRGDDEGSGGVHRVADRPEWLDRAEHGWGADVGGGGEEINL